MFETIKLCRRKGITWKQLANHLLYRVTQKRGPYLRYDPVTLIFAVTDRCTFRCNMCHVHSPLIKPEPHFNVKKRDIPYELFCDVIRTFPRTLNVSFVGTGEPLLHKDICRMIAFAHDRHMVTSTITNGFLLDDQSEAICNSELDHISISINGYSKEDFFRLTGMKAEIFDVVLENVSRLVTERDRQKHHLRIAVSFILDTTNYEHTNWMLSMAADLKVDECYFHNFIPSNTDGFRAEERSLFYSEEMERFFRELPTPPDMKIGLPGLLRKDRKFRGCHFLFTTFRIDSDGNTGSCGGSLLNLNGHSKYTEPNVWNNNYLTSLRELFLTRKQELPGPCYLCPANY